MTNSTTRVGFFAVAAALVAATACGKTTPSTDEALKRDLAAAMSAGGDLELAPRRARSQVVVSAIEGGPAAAPKRAARRTVQSRKTQTATPRVAVTSEKAPAPTIAEPASAPVVEPPPLPPATRGPSSRQQGTYKTEAEIFRQMPWIRP